MTFSFKDWESTFCDRYYPYTTFICICIYICIFLRGEGKGIGGRGTYVGHYIAVWILNPVVSLGGLSTNVFERRTVTGSELFSPIMCLDAAKFVLLSFFALIETIC